LITLDLPSTSLFIFNDTATTQIYTLSLHDALPISAADAQFRAQCRACAVEFRMGIERRLIAPTFEQCQFVRVEHALEHLELLAADRKSTRLNSSHVAISYAVFCLKKKNSLDSIRPA